MTPIAEQEFARKQMTLTCVHKSTIQDKPAMFLHIKYQVIIWACIAFAGSIIYLAQKFLQIDMLFKSWTKKQPGWLLYLLFALGCILMGFSVVLIFSQ